MDAARWKQIDELIDAALELPENEREQFVSSKTTEDIQLRDEVLLLLRAQKDGSSFLLKSAMNVAARNMGVIEVIVDGEIIDTIDAFSPELTFPGTRNTPSA